MRIARVFPSRTSATPSDPLAFVGEPPATLVVDAVHISVLFSWDIPEAERLEKLWSRLAPVTLGGPALGSRGEQFVPGMYMDKGYVITSRGCPNRCWFCSVWRREGRVVRELEITDGWKLCDDNLLACSEKHVRAVFRMLNRQERYAELTGGLEAARLKDWHIELLTQHRISHLYFAWDTPDDEEPLRIAAKKLITAGMSIKSHVMRAYILIGFPKDTIEMAQHRLEETVKMGVMPLAMLWRDQSGNRDQEWMRFQREWANSYIVGSKMTKMLAGIKVPGQDAGAITRKRKAVLKKVRLVPRRVG